MVRHFSQKGQFVRRTDCVKHLLSDFFPRTYNLGLGLTAPIICRPTFHIHFLPGIDCSNHLSSDFFHWCGQSEVKFLKSGTKSDYKLLPQTVRGVNCTFCEKIGPEVIGTVSLRPKDVLRKIQTKRIGAVNTRTKTNVPRKNQTTGDWRSQSEASVLRSGRKSDRKFFELFFIISESLL